MSTNDPDLVCRTERWRGEPSLPGWWPPLFEATPDAGIFLSPPWMQTWLETYGPRFRGEWIRWEQGTNVVAGMLLVRGTVLKGILPLRCLFVNATAEDSERPPLAEYNDVLALPGHRDAIAARLRSRLDASPWDCLALSGHAPGSVLDRAFGSLPASFARHDARPAPYLDFALLGDAPYDSVLGANTASQIRRSIRLYESRSGPLTSRSATNVDEALAFLDAMIPLHNRRWESKGAEGSFAHALRRQFHRGLVPRLLQAGALDFRRIAAGTREIGYLYNFVHRGKAYSFQSGFVYEEDRRLKPGLVCHRLAAEAYRRQGLREYDFLAGDARYKRSLANAERTLDWSLLYRDRVWLRALVYAWRARNRLAASIAMGEST